MDDQERYMLKKGQLFNKLLGTPSYGSVEVLLRDAKDLGLFFSQPFHRIVVAELETWGELISRTEYIFDPEDRAEAFFVLSNVGVDLFSLGKDCHVTFTDFQGRMVFWIDSEMDYPEADFVRAGQRVAQLVESEFQSVISVSISRCIENLTEVFYVYQDTVTLLHYNRYISSSDSVYTMNQCNKRGNNAALRQKIQWERRILDAIDKRELEELKNLLHDSYRRLFQEEPPSLWEFPRKHAGFLDLLQCTLSELTLLYPNLNLTEWNRAIDQAETAQAQMEIMEDILDLVSESMEHSDAKAPAWIPILMEYVKTNYSDPSITVYRLADMVGITPSYCSRVFRKFIGKSLLEYIQRIRVSAAIELLEQGKTMSQAADGAGFTCTQTLRRTMKQYRSGE